MEKERKKEDDKKAIERKKERKKTHQLASIQRNRLPANKINKILWKSYSPYVSRLHSNKCQHYRICLFNKIIYKSLFGT